MRAVFPYILLHFATFVQYFTTVYTESRPLFHISLFLYISSLLCSEGSSFFLPVFIFVYVVKRMHFFFQHALSFTIYIIFVWLLASGITYLTYDNVTCWQQHVNIRRTIIHLQPHQLRFVFVYARPRLKARNT